MNYFKILFLTLLAAILTACGGGGGDPGGTGNNGGGGTGTKPIVAKDFIYLLDKNSIDNTGADKVKLSITALNEINNPVASAPVKVSVSSGVFTSTQTTTDTKGEFVGDITIGGNKEDRDITVKITVSTISKEIVIPVQGSQVSISTIPTDPAINAPISTTVAVKDKLGNFVANTSVVIEGKDKSGNLVPDLSGRYTTDVNGSVVVNKNAPTVPGNYTLTVKASGVSANSPLNVGFQQTYPEVPLTTLFNGQALTADPTAINTNATGSTTNRSQVIAKFFTTNQQTIPNMRVRFYIDSPSLGTDEILTTGNNTVYSNASGEVTTTYIPGIRNSPTNGVRIRACYDRKEFPIATGRVFTNTNCPNSLMSTLTVSNRPMGISIASHNKLTKGLGGIAYIEQFLVQVTDASGKPAKGVRISENLDITHFGKGTYGRDYFGFNNLIPPTIALRYGSNEYSWYQPSSAPSETENMWCQNEDVNRDGVLNAGEDLDQNGSLTPVKSDISLSFVNGNVTDDNGQLLIQTIYGQNYGTWLAYTIRLSTDVVGTEGISERSFMTGVMKEDAENGSFRVPPFGRNACNARD